MRKTRKILKNGSTYKCVLLRPYCFRFMPDRTRNALKAGPVWPLSPIKDTQLVVHRIQFHIWTRDPCCTRSACTSSTSKTSCICFLFPEPAARLGVVVAAVAIVYDARVSRGDVIQGLSTFCRLAAWGTAGSGRERDTFYSGTAAASWNQNETATFCKFFAIV